MITSNDVTKENIKEHNPNWRQTLHHSYRMLLIGGPGSGKTNSLFNLTSHWPEMIKFIFMLKIHMK